MMEFRLLAVELDGLSAELDRLPVVLKLEGFFSVPEELSSVF